MDLPRAPRAIWTIFALLVLVLGHLIPPARAAKPAAKPVPAAQKLAASLLLAEFGVREASVKDAMDRLRQKSVELSPETNGLNIALSPEAQADPTKISIYLRDSSLSEAIRYVALLAKMKSTYNAKGVLIEPASAAELAKATPTVVKKKADSALERARRLIIPKLEFREATLQEAHDIMRSRNRGDEGDMRTVNLVLVPSAPEDATFDIKKEKISLYDALSEIARLTKHTMVVDPEAFVFWPLQPSATPKSLPRRN